MREVIDPSGAISEIPTDLTSDLVPNITRDDLRIAPGLSGANTVTLAVPDYTTVEFDYAVYEWNPKSGDLTELAKEDWRGVFGEDNAAESFANDGGTLAQHPDAPRVPRDRLFRFLD